jgi:hypothetical protein
MLAIRISRMPGRIHLAIARYSARLAGLHARANIGDLKMKIIKIIATTIGLTALSLSCFAQEEEEGPIAYTYATYFYCGGDSLDRADDIIADDADRMNGFVEDGTILRWGWLEHHTGGGWQRALYYQAESIEALLNAYDAMNADDGEDEAAADDDDGPGFGDICPRHEDYIWQADHGSNSETRGAAGFSVYYMCDLDREQRAGELVEEHMGPILDGFVDDGKLSSWGWSTHVVGGRYRALQTMTAPDMQSLMAARSDVIATVYAEDSEAGTEFAQICGPHSDYLWNIQLEN